MAEFGGLSFAELENRFNHHPPKDGQAEKYTAMRAQCLKLAKFIVTNTPYCREQAEALTCLQNAMMWANAAVACRDNQ